jgi:serine/threonine protein kinase
MCTVYKADDLQLNRTVAIKVLHERLIRDKSALFRFDREARAISALEHPNIVRIYSFDLVGSKPYMVTEYLEGISLSELLRRKGPLRKEQAIPIFLQICDALSHAHAAGIIHRDLKPSNVMLVGPEQTVKVVDFGIASIRGSSKDAMQKLTQSSVVLGTPLYISPEQCRGEAADARSDLYSLGCLMYETLSGSPPFQASTALAVLQKHASEPMPESELLNKSGLRDAISSCLSKSADSRPNSAEVLKEMLLAPQSPLAALPLRNWLRIAAAACVTIAVLCGLLWYANRKVVANADLRQLSQRDVVKKITDDSRGNHASEVRRVADYILDPDNKFAKDDRLAALFFRINSADGYDNAIADLKSCDELADTMPSGNKSKVALEYYDFFFGRGAWQQALAYANKAIRLGSPQSSDNEERYELAVAWLARTECDLKLGLLSDAKTSLSQAVDVIRSPRHHLPEGRVRFLCGRAITLDDDLIKAGMRSDSVQLCRALLWQCEVLVNCPDDLGVELKILAQQESGIKEYDLARDLSAVAARIHPDYITYGEEEARTERAFRKHVVGR